MKYLGTRQRVIDWDARTRGSLEYSGDVKLDGLLEGLILRSPHPHAKITRIDTSKARSLPGVHAVITAADFPPGARYFHEGALDRPPLADGVVRFVGQEVAAVAAKTRQQAHAALRAIVVEYEPLPGPLTTASALGRGVSRLHDRPTGEPNLAHRVKRNWGEAEAGRRSSSISVSGNFLFPRQTHACMETSVAVARWDEGDQRLEFWTSTQAPYYVAKEVATVLGLKQEQVICHEVGVGGGFGSKSKICEHEAVAGLLARSARRPVRLRLSREEEFETSKTRHAFSMSMKLYADSSGRLRAIDGVIDVDNGSYNHSGVSVMGAGIKGLGMLYRPDGLQVTGRLIDTALTPGGQFRGYGTVQTSFAVECLMDDLAEKLGIDPIELRVRNANQAGETTLVGAQLGSARLVECLRAARDAIGWEKERSNRRPGRGVGVSSSVHVSGSFTAPGANRSDAAIDVFTNGRVRVRFGGADAGTGQKTILAQVAAEELGVAFEDVDVLTMESDKTPFDMGAWSSRGTHFGGHAVRKAALATAERLKGLAASQLGAGELRLDSGMVKSGTRGIPIGEIAQLSNDLKDGALTTEASFVEESIVLADRETGKGNVSASYNFAAHAAVVEVDRRTGHIKVVDYVAVHDIGFALNRITTEGQAIGGTVMGLGAALSEEVIFEQGKMVNPAYLHYALPRAADVPRIRPILIEGGDPRGPYGAKAIGECSINPPASVISNAVYDAIGVRVRELPITPDKIINALAKGEGRRRSHHIWRRPSRWWIALVRWAYPRGLLKILHERNARFSSCIEPRPLDKVETPTALASVVGAKKSDAMVFGGGTDLQLCRRQGLAEPRRLISLAKVAELQGVRILADGTIEVGAAVTLSALATAMRHRIPVIAQTIDNIASAQIREMATVAGNLIQAKRCWFYRNGFGCYKRLGGLAPCYAVEGDHRFYHAAIDGHRCQATTPSDLATVFCAARADAIIAGPRGERVVAMEAFHSGPGETVLAEDEVLRMVRIPADATARRGAFVKLRLWEGDFAIASVAMTAKVAAGGSLHDPRIIIGGLAPTPWRARATERYLDGKTIDVADFRQALDRELDAAAHPLPRNGWKLDAAAGLAEQAFASVLCANQGHQATPPKESA
jgi:CO/xanthine dehydrogenase Mo-binding subunit/CO/xanthine dehydrogenase FAD-binding subunit